MHEEIFEDVSKRMNGAIDSLHSDLKGLRTGRASVNLLDPVYVEAYGDKMPINQLGNISVPEPRMLTIQVWDKSMIKPIEKAIANSNLGVNPSSEGATIRIMMPPLTEERRKDLVKLAKKYAENSKISLRNIRRDVLDQIKKLEKDGMISEDDQHKYNDKVQDMIDKFVKQIDEDISSKEKEILNL